MAGKGQVSAEYLIILAVSLAAIAIAANALFSFYDQYRDGMAQSHADSVARQIHDAAEQVCLFGEGNSRTVDGLPGNFSIVQDPYMQNTAMVAVDGKESSLETSCGMIITSQDYSQKVAITYSSGAIELS